MGSVFASNKFLISILMLALILAVADLMVVTGSILLLVFAGLLFGALLHGVSQWLTERSGLPRIAAYLIVVTLLIAMIATGFIHLGSQIVLRWEQLWSEMVVAVENGRQQLKEQGWSSSVLPTQDEIESMVKDADSQILPRMLDGLLWVGWGLAGDWLARS